MIARRSISMLSSFLVLGMLFAPALACKTDGIIDWEGYQVHKNPVNDVAKEGWNENSTPVSDYVVWDGDAFLPKPTHKIGEPIAFKVLAGTGLLEQGHEGEWCNVEIWAWVDVNRNRKADQDDRIRVKGVPSAQSWRLVADMEMVVNQGQDIIPDAKVPGQDYYAYDYFQPGLNYLLLIRVYYSGTDSWAWHCQIAGDCDHIWVQSGSQASTDWESSGPKAYGDETGEALTPGVSWGGIDDWEILWIRFVAPPLPPGPHGPTR